MQAWAALALCLAIEAREAPLPASVVANLRLRAQRAAERAFQLDPEAALAHAALAALEPICGAFAQSESHVRRALAAMPDDPDTLNRMGRWCRSVGRVREALVHSTRAFEIDPLVPTVMNLQFFLLAGAGRVAESEAIRTAGRQRWPQIEFFAIPPLYTAANANDWPLVDRVLADINERGPRTPFMRSIVEDVERRRKGVADDFLVANLRRALAETGTVSLRDAVEACAIGRTDEVYAILSQASFAHLFEPGGRLLPGDYGTHQLLGGVGPLQRDTRFVQLCAKLGLCDYWVKSDTWPDCAEQLAKYYDFKSEVRRLVSG